MTGKATEEYIYGLEAQLEIQEGNISEWDKWMRKHFPELMVTPE